MTEKPTTNEKVAIIGFSDVNIKDINEFLKIFKKKNSSSVQFFAAKHIAGRQHLYFAAINALNSFKKKTNISESLAIEALLYASAQRQIEKAVKMLGIKQNTSEVAVLIIAENEIENTNYLAGVIDWNNRYFTKFKHSLC